MDLIEIAGALALCVVAGLLICIGPGYLETLFRRRRLIRSGRSISWSDAVERTPKYEGYFVIDCSSAIGGLWWIRGQITDNSLELFNLLSDSALLVIDGPKRNPNELLEREEPLYAEQRAVLDMDPE